MVKHHFVVGRNSPQERIDFQVPGSALEQKTPANAKIFQFREEFYVSVWGNP
jgi:hypothetical protein